MSFKSVLWIAVILVNALLLGPVELAKSVGVYALVVVGFIVIHELGHASVGLLTGNRVVGIQVGAHKALVRLRFGSFRLVIRRLVIAGGATILSTRHRALFRTRRAIVLVAGVGAELVGLWLVYQQGWNDAFGGRLGLTALLVVVLDVAANLIPRRTDDDQMNDGAQLLALWHVSDEEIDALIAAHGSVDLIVDFAEKAEDGDFDELAAIGAAAAARTPGSIDAHRSHALGLMHTGDFDNARRAMDEIIRRSNQIPDDKMWIIRNDVAYLYALIGDPALLPAAERLSAEAMAEKDHPAVRGTRGAVLVQTGQPAEGIRLLEAAQADQPTDRDRFETHRFLILGHLEIGDPWSAREAYAAAMELPVDPARVVALRPRLGAAEAVHLVNQRRTTVELTDAEQRQRVGIASELLGAWLDSEVGDDRRRQLYERQGGEADDLTDGDMTFLAGVANQLTTAS